MEGLTDKQKIVYEAACKGTSARKIAIDFKYTSVKSVYSLLRRCKLKGFQVRYGEQYDLFR